MRLDTSQNRLDQSRQVYQNGIKNNVWAGFLSKDSSMSMMKSGPGDYKEYQQVSKSKNRGVNMQQWLQHRSTLDHAKVNDFAQMHQGNLSQSRLLNISQFGDGVVSLKPQSSAGMSRTMTYDNGLPQKAPSLVVSQLKRFQNKNLNEDLNPIDLDFGPDEK